MTSYPDLKSHLSLYFKEAVQRNSFSEFFKKSKNPLSRL
ncbi:hypothetical protein JTE90_025903, partial [Oedothorax gibbosus]